MNPEIYISGTRLTKSDTAAYKVYEGLKKLGYKTLYMNGSVLCKTSDVTEESIESICGNNKTDEETVKIIRMKCSKLNTGVCTATIQNKICMQTGCPVPSIHCPMYGNTPGQGGTTPDDAGDSSGTLETLNNDNYLIRVFPNDTQSGIFLHAIMLHNEECDFKMNFYIKDSIPEVVSNIIHTIIFLTT